MIRNTVTNWSGDISSAAPAIVFDARHPLAPPWHSGRKQGTSKRHGGVTRRKVTMMFGRGDMRYAKSVVLEGFGASMRARLLRDGMAFSCTWRRRSQH
jgi:hypothetical protein